MKNSNTFYACPYCSPSIGARLIVTKAMGRDCSDHKKSFFFGDKECKEQKYKCKEIEVMKCKECKNQFVPDKKFLKKQKRKIKDG